MSKQESNSTPALGGLAAPLREGADFYWENGLMVLTGDFLKRRGYCCKSDCRHCPYGYNKSASTFQERRQIL